MWGAVGRRENKVGVVRELDGPSAHDRAGVGDVRQCNIGVGTRQIRLGAPGDIARVVVKDEAVGAVPVDGPVTLPTRHRIHRNPEHIEVIAG